MNKTVIEVLTTLEKNGFLAYLVGGYPRDLYMGKESTDYDICTSAKPKDIKKLFNKYTVPSDNYGCVTLFIDKKRFEITTFRKDITYFNNRLPLQIKYVKDLKTDLQRRDFKMNTICIDSKGNYIDLLNGREDIDNKIIKVVGDTNKKIKEDALRILRAIRFATTLGFELAEELKQSILDNGYLVKKLSYERKKKELDKIFSSPNSMRGIALLKEFYLDKYLEIKLDNIKFSTQAIGYWAQINSDKYKFNKTENEQIKKIIKMLNLEDIDDNALYKYGLYLGTVVGELKGIDKQYILRKYNELAIHDKSEIAIEPLEICELLNKEPGSFLNEIIKDLEKKIIKNDILNEKNQLKDYIINTYEKNIDNKHEIVNIK